LINESESVMSEKLWAVLPAHERFSEDLQVDNVTGERIFYINNPAHGLWVNNGRI